MGTLGYPISSSLFFNWFTFIQTYHKLHQLFAICNLGTKVEVDLFARIGSWVYEIYYFSVLVEVFVYLDAWDVAAFVSVHIKLKSGFPKLMHLVFHFNNLLSKRCINQSYLRQNWEHLQVLNNIIALLLFLTLIQKQHGLILIIDGFLIHQVHLWQQWKCWHILIYIWHSIVLLMVSILFPIVHGVFVRKEIKNYNE